ncbi:MAG: hypothetical protein HPY60_11695 [Candidatus Methanofastidiosum sp.]|nr:hypothetical protein [Methanofastidiosum sp.]
MKTKISRALILLFPLFIASCAATYKPINPPSVYYDSHELKDGVKLSYKYDVLREKEIKSILKKRIVKI